MKSQSVASRKSELEAARKSLRKAEKSQAKAQAKADQKEYDRNHAQLKRQQAFHSALLAAQVRRGKKQSKRDGAA